MREINSATGAAAEDLTRRRGDTHWSGNLEFPGESGAKYGTMDVMPGDSYLRTSV